VDTPMVRDAPDDPARQGRTPMGRRAAPEKIVSLNLSQFVEDQNGPSI
jgi:hypothetical protein